MYVDNATDINLQAIHYRMNHYKQYVGVAVWLLYDRRVGSIECIHCEVSQVKVRPGRVPASQAKVRVMPAPSPT